MQWWIDSFQKLMTVWRSTCGFKNEVWKKTQPYMYIGQPRTSCELIVLSRKTLQLLWPSTTQYKTNFTNQSNLFSLWSHQSVPSKPGTTHQSWEPYQGWLSNKSQLKYTQSMTTNCPWNIFRRSTACCLAFQPFCIKPQYQPDVSVEWYDLVEITTTE